MVFVKLILEVMKTRLKGKNSILEDESKDDAASEGMANVKQKKTSAGKKKAIKINLTNNSNSRDNSNDPFCNLQDSKDSKKDFDQEFRERQKGGA